MPASAADNVAKEKFVVVDIPEASYPSQPFGGGAVRHAQKNLGNQKRRVGTDGYSDRLPILTVPNKTVEYITDQARPTISFRLNLAVKRPGNTVRIDRVIKPGDVGHQQISSTRP